MASSENIELLVIAFIGFGVVGAAYYQSGRDRRKWERALSGKRPPPVSNEVEIPPLNVDGVSIDPHNRPVLVIWHDLRSARFYTNEDAIREIEREFFAGKPWAKGARMFVWRGVAWTQWKYKLPDKPTDPLAKYALLANALSMSIRWAGVLPRSFVNLLVLLDRAPELLWRSIARFKIGKRRTANKPVSMQKQADPDE